MDDRATIPKEVWVWGAAERLEGLDWEVCVEGAAGGLEGLGWEVWVEGAAGGVGKGPDSGSRMVVKNMPILDDS